ncbi:hypothetical protein PR202_ga05985 [Eleusine coracana subsp. coracana]|uniref:Uncharacterized protein n=1 Tax=Eleusine coracana subsp. coracana TaxID=191504 RepID=A0AAV5BU93_ELECO|nr:hypothetical protein PR202_ga05985 [Eleusine coracana subsp. coracana]
MDEDGEDVPTPREIERQRRGALRLVRLKWQQQQRMRPRPRRGGASVEARAARCLAASSNQAAGALASGYGGTPENGGGVAAITGGSVAQVTRGESAPASEAWVPPSRREAEAGMRRVMAELKYLPEQPTPDDSELLFPIRKPVDDYNHSSGPK